MSTLRFNNSAHWHAIETHLAEDSLERFAFALTRTVSNALEGPVLEVEGVELMQDDEIEHDHTGSTILGAALDRVHNRAVTQQQGLVEFHNHALGPARFSPTDETGLEPMAEYIIDLLDGRPYGAAVRANGTLHAEWFRPEDHGIERGTFRSVTVVDERLRLLNARPLEEARFHRQVPILGQSGQASLRQLRIAVIGEGGTGSHAVSLLAYLGIRDFLLLDDDVIDTTSLNRVVTADPADIDAPKTLVARRRVLTLDSDATVRAHGGLTPRGDHRELCETDLLVGCVDSDGPRHLLNELAVDSGVPYLDIGTGVDPETDPPSTGARVAFVLPGRPCLTCTEELDPLEVARWYKPVEQQDLDRAHGYGTNEAAPSVVYLNGLAVNAAITELVAWITGTRSPASRLDIDVDGDTAVPGIRVAPTNDMTRRPGCIDCSWKAPSDGNTAAV